MRTHIDILHGNVFTTKTFDISANGFVYAFEDIAKTCKEAGLTDTEIFRFCYYLQELHQLRIGTNTWTVWFGA